MPIAAIRVGEAICVGWRDDPQTWDLVNWISGSSPAVEDDAIRGAGAMG